ncbi:MAG: SDR family oxidoreductase [Bacteroidia bacterium]
MSKRFQNKVFWITGASSGIGEAIAWQAIAEGAKVVLSARRKNELERVKEASSKPENCMVLPLDLTQSDSFPAALAKVEAHFGPVDVLVNNGGISQRGQVWETDLSVHRRIMEINYFGAVALTKTVLPTMVERKSGHVVGISSLSGKFGWHQRSAYAASKHALDGFLETAWLELQPHNVHTTIVSPGRIKTNISYNALTADGTQHGQLDPGQVKGLPADVCAKKVLHAVERQKAEVIIGKADRIMYWLKRFWPGGFRWLALRIEAS